MKFSTGSGIKLGARQSQRLTRRILAASFLFAVAIGGLVTFMSHKEKSFGAANGDYRSVASGDWNNPATWEVFSGGSWIAAVATPTSANGVITIQSSHTVNITANVTIDQVVVDTNAVLNITGGTLSLANGTGNDLTINGELNVGSIMTIAGNAVIHVNNIANCNAGGTMSFGGGSKIHINNSAIFNKNAGTVTTNSGFWKVNTGGTFRLNDQSSLPLATWSVGSTCEINGVTNTVPANINQQYANFTWNCPSQSASLNFSGSLQTIGGDFKLISTGAGYIQLDLQGNNSALEVDSNFYVYGGVLYGCTNGGTTLDIGKDYIQTGGLFAFNLAGGTAYGNSSMVMTVTGNVNISGGTMDLSQCTANNSSKGNGILIIIGNLNLSGSGLMTETSVQSRGQVYFGGTTTQYFTSTSLNTVTRYVDFTVSSGAILRMDDQILPGWGNFTLENGGGLMSGHHEGITTTGAFGSIQVTGTRTYNIGSDYTYNGSVTQQTGNGLPYQVRNLTFNNGSNINLTASTSVSSNLNFIAGICIAANDTLTLGINAATRGTLNRTSGHVVGYFKRWFASSNTANTLFPVGTMLYYNPAYFSYTNSPSSGSIVCKFNPTNPGTLGLPLTDAGTQCYTMGYAYWSFGGMNGISGGQCTVKLVANGFPGVNDYTTLHLLRRVGSGSPWTTNGLHAAGTGSNSTAEANRTKMTLLGDYGISSDAVNPLPIELISFEAKANTEYVDLKWATETETNCDYFTIERSADGVNFTKLLTKKGAGNSTVVKEYAATDLSPLPGYSYYQLRQTDLNGHSTLSNIVIVQFDKNDLKDNSLKIISVSNFSGRFTLKYRTKPNSELKLMLLNMAGKLIYETQLQSPERLNTFEYIDERNLPAGVYFIQIVGEGQKIIQKVVKENG